MINTARICAMSPARSSTGTSTRIGMTSTANRPGEGRVLNKKSCLLKVVVLGDSGVGKTSLISRFVSDKFDPCSFHTIGVEFLNRDVEVDGVRYTLQHIWDTAGQERFKSLRTPFYRGTDICVLTYAVDEPSSFANLTTWRREFLYYAGIEDGRAACDFPFLVVANKSDVDSETRQINADDAMEWCNANGQLPHVETSAKNSTNVTRAFAVAVERWIVMEEKFDRVRPFLAGGDTVKLHGQRRRRSSEATRVRDQCCGLF